MARVVTQRAGTPYALIVFVFLFLVSTAVAVLQHLEAVEAREAAADAKALAARFASADERESTKFTRLLKGVGQTGGTVYSQLVDEVRAVAQLVTGGTDHGLKEAQDRTKKATAVLRDGEGKPVSELANLLPGKDESLADKVERLKRRLLTGQKQIARVQDKLRKTQADLAAAKDSAVAQQRDLEQQIAALNERIGVLDERLKANQHAREQAVKDLADTYEQKRQELQRTISQKQDEIEDLKRTTVILQTRYEDALEAMKELKGKKTDLLLEPDGKVVRVLEENKLCYIGLGRRDRVRPGMTFSVFSQEGFGDPNATKGSVLVTDVGERVSTCRIVARSKTDPIVSGDYVMNIAYDPLKTYAFVVEGYFELTGREKGAVTGADEVKAMIRRYGGRIAEEVTTQTDYVVMGRPPEKPAPPPEAEDDPLRREIYNRKLAAWEHYQDVEEEARLLQIPVFNENRFRLFTGFGASLPTGG
jgi:hypothetical protein